jgi:hypothetical protein
MPTVIGEMAHVIADSPIGPRGDGEGRDNSYANLILLCPTHHTLVDKAPHGTFPATMLWEWKAAHEARVSRSVESPKFPDRKAMNLHIRSRLLQNRTCWATHGPESEVARHNPQSSVAAIWPFRKLSLIIPNNRYIISAVGLNVDLLTAAEYEVACRFIEHAEGFERNCMTFLEGVPRFPVEFAEMFNG